MIGLDTMGQDREFTKEEKRFALKTVMDFSQIWEAREKENLTKDRNLKLHMIDIDKEFTDTHSAKLAEDEEEAVKEHITSITVVPPPAQT